MGTARFLRRHRRRPRRIPTSCRTSPTTPRTTPFPARHPAEAEEDPYKLSDLPDEPVLEPLELVVSQRQIRVENERTLKEAQDPGTRLPFWQIGDYVLLGASHPPEYYQHFLDRGAAAGWVTVVSRGNTLRRNPGLLQVVGSSDPESFETTFAYFTNKRIEFV